MLLMCLGGLHGTMRGYLVRTWVELDRAPESKGGLVTSGAAQRLPHLAAPG